ncbi:MAG: beta-lactamase domain protein [Chlorobi bacterium]|nr:beta-lactamase domain protein [Chlorobiota bacterium]
MKVTFLGSGTSTGVPTVGCTCAICRSSDPRDKRLRPSVWVEFHDTSIILDTATDFRQQCLRAGIDKLNAVIYTHHHFDHIGGFDDLRAFNFKMGRPIPIYGMPETLDCLRQMFAYAFTDSANQESSRPHIIAHTILDDPFDVDGHMITPLRLSHGRMRVNGYRIGNFAYCTDCNAISEEAAEQLQGIDTLVLDALRFTQHPTHFTLQQAIDMAERLGPRRTYFTHIAHEIGHAEVDSTLPASMSLAYDGLILDIDEG